jgi:hypothetical protein
VIPYQTIPKDEIAQRKTYKEEKTKLSTKSFAPSFDTSNK